METRKRNIVFDFENTQSRKYWLDTYRRTFSSCSFGFCLLCCPFCRLQFSRRRSFLLLLISLRLLLWERYIANAYWQTKYKTTDIQLWWTICIKFWTNLFLLLFFFVLCLRIGLLSLPLSLRGAARVQSGRRRGFRFFFVGGSRLRCRGFRAFSL
jgi:hypothetical protein